jgi:cytochrome P450
MSRATPPFLSSRVVEPGPVAAVSGPRGNLLLGSLKDYRGDLLGFITRCARDHGDFVPVRVVTHRGFLINDPRLIGEVLTTRNEDFRKVFMLRNNKLFLGNGMLTSEHEIWRPKRRLAQPVFHHDRLENYAHIIVEEAARTADQWQSGGVKDVQNEMMSLTLRVVVRCLFDTAAHVDTGRIGRNVEVVQRRMSERIRALIPLPDTAPTPDNIPLRLAIWDLDRIVNNFIRRRRERGADGTDLLSSLMRAEQQGVRLTDRELRDEAMTMLFAGHETTALALSWSWYLLSAHPAEARALCAELDRVLGGRPPTLRDLPDLVVAHQIVKEAMRLYPPIYAFGRDAVRDTTIGGHRVPKGTSAMIAPWVIHRDARFYPAPQEFRPGRWTADFERGLPRFAYIPFGGGARMCIGRAFAMTEAVLALATLAQRYRLTLADGHPIELWPTFSLRSRHGMVMNIHSRKSATGRQAGLESAPR